MLMLFICRLGMANDSGSNSRKRKAGKTRVAPLNGDDNRSGTKANTDHGQLYKHTITLFCLKVVG